MVSVILSSFDCDSHRPFLRGRSRRVQLFQCCWESGISCMGLPSYGCVYDPSTVYQHCSVVRSAHLVSSGQAGMFQRDVPVTEASSGSQLSVLFDILPLWLIPALMFGGIVYGLIGLVPTVTAFWKFILNFVLFNLTTPSVMLLFSITFSGISECVLNIS